MIDQFNCHWSSILSYQHVHHDQPSDHIDHLLHAVDEEGSNEEEPGGADGNSPNDGHLVEVLSEVGRGDEDV